jgi:DNA-directed RNA polymerase specialized sigma24 family protein
MRLNQELAFKEIGLVLNMSEGTAKVNYHHGINKLREWLKDEYEI